MMGEVRLRSRGSWWPVRADGGATVEQVEERIDVRRVPGFEPVLDSTEKSKKPRIRWENQAGSAGQNGSENGS